MTFLSGKSAVFAYPDNDETIVGIINDPEFSALNFASYWKIPVLSEAVNNTAMIIVDDLMADIISNAIMECFSELKTVPTTPLNDAVFTSQNLCETLDAILKILCERTNH